MDDGAASGHAGVVERTRCFVLLRSAAGERRARLLIESLRAFGGWMRDCPVWVFHPDPTRTTLGAGLDGVQILPLMLESDLADRPFVDKVGACAQAEELAARQDVRTIVWLSPSGLIVNPPLLFDLGASFAAALRPVHIRNIGALAGEPLDEFWQQVYQRVGITDTEVMVESYVDRAILRPYYNSHLFAIDPGLGVMRAWRELLLSMLSDREFQSGPCRDGDHQIFLHQAILSTLVTRMIDHDRLRILPAEYSYPLHFHPQVPSDRRPRALDELVCPVYEEVFRYPETLNGITVREPLHFWLRERMPG